MSLQSMLAAVLIPLLTCNPTFQSDLSPSEKLGQVVVKNADVFSSDQITRIAGIRLGQSINDQVIEKAAQRIKKAYLRRGFIEVEASIRKEVAFDPARDKNRIVHLEIAIDEGSSFHIRRTEVEGNEKTNHNVVMRAAGGLRPDQPYDPQQVETWMAGMNRLGRFERVKKEDIEIKIDKQGHFVDLLFHVKEKAGLRTRRN